MPTTVSLPPLRQCTHSSHPAPSGHLYRMTPSHSTVGDWTEVGNELKESFTGLKGIHQMVNGITWILLLRLFPLITEFLILLSFN